MSNEFLILRAAARQVVNAKWKFIIQLCFFSCIMLAREFFADYWLPDFFIMWWPRATDSDSQQQSLTKDIPWTLVILNYSLGISYYDQRGPADAKWSFVAHRVFVRSCKICCHQEHSFCITSLWAVYTGTTRQVCSITVALFLEFCSWFPESKCIYCSIYFLRWRSVS